MKKKLTQLDYLKAIRKPMPKQGQAFVDKTKFNRRKKWNRVDEEVHSDESPSDFVRKEGFR